MITKKTILQYNNINSFNKFELEDRPLEEVISLLQEVLKLTKEKYPNCKYNLDFYCEYDLDMVRVIAEREETDEEFNKRIEEEKQHALQQKAYWDNKVKEF